MKYQKRKPPKIQALMGFKPMTKQFPAFEMSKMKPYKISQERSCEISKEKAQNIMAFIGFKPMTSITKYFPAYEISKESLKNSGFDGIKTNDLKKYFPAFKISKKKAYKILKERACGI